MRPLLFLSLLIILGCTEKQKLVDVQLNRLDGTVIQLDPSETTLTVIYFLSPECPLCINYTLVMRNLEQKFGSDSLRFYGIYSKEWFSANEVREYQLKYKLEFEMLLDEGNRLANALDASVTPEAFVFDQKGKKVYSGKIDNWVNDLGKKKLEVSENYLENALIAALNGEDIQPKRTEPIGCLIE